MHINYGQKQFYSHFLMSSHIFVRSEENVMNFVEYFWELSSAYPFFEGQIVIYCLSGMFIMPAHQVYDKAQEIKLSSEVLL